jgi:hypothetical protein
MTSINAVRIVGSDAVWTPDRTWNDDCRCLEMAKCLVLRVCGVGSGGASSTGQLHHRRSKKLGTHLRWITRPAAVTSCRARTFAVSPTHSSLKLFSSSLVCLSCCRRGEKSSYGQTCLLTHICRKRLQGPWGFEAGARGFVRSPCFTLSHPPLSAIRRIFDVIRHPSDWCWSSIIPLLVRCVHCWRSLPRSRRRRHDDRLPFVCGGDIAQPLDNLGRVLVLVQLEMLVKPGKVEIKCLVKVELRF